MPFFPRQLKRISPHFYVYRNRYEFFLDTYPVLRLTVRGGSLPAEEEGDILKHFGFDPRRRIRMELTPSTVIYEQASE